MAGKIIDDAFFPCILQGRDMCEGECYDVQMVRTRMIKADILDFELDRTKADSVCDDCTYNQLKQSADKVESVASIA